MATSDIKKGPLYVDSTNNRVGVGTASPATALDVTGSVNISNSSGATLKLTSTDTSGADTELLGQIDFVSSDVSSGSAGTQARIKGVYEDNGDSTGIAFLTGNSTGSGSPTINEVMRIRHEGNVGIGTSNPVRQLMVQSAVNSTGYIEMLRLEGQTLSNGWERGIGFFGNDGGLEVSRISSYLTGLERHLRFTSAGVLGMTIRETGNVGIGATSPSELLHIRNASGDAAVRIQGNTRTFNIQQNNYGLRFVDVDAGSVERMRIDASGNLLVGTTSSSFSSGGTSYTPKFAVDSGSSNIAYFKSSGAGAGVVVNNVYGSGTRYLISFDTATARVGDITTNGTSTTYGTPSDYRLKENVTDITDATTRLKQLNPVRFNFIADADTTVDGFLAHEVQDIVPEAITGTKDGMRDEEYEVTPAVEATYDDEGNVLTEAVPAVMGTRSVPDYQGIDQSKLVPLLVKTIIELEARITALEAN